MGYSAAKPKSDFPEFGVRYEMISSFFSPPLARSTFHDLVKKGKVRPMKGLKGFYLLNDSLRRLGLKEVRQLPKEESRSLEDIVRFAFTLIDETLFPAPSWLLHVESIDVKDADHVLQMANRYRDKVESYDNVALKLAYFQGALDWASIMTASGESEKRPSVTRGK